MVSQLATEHDVYPYDHSQLSPDVVADQVIAPDQLGGTGARKM